jgi:predicted AAA+ superfamily ATPase
VLLLGPRQVGKSTLINSLKPEMTINLADQSEYQAFLSSSEELKERIELSHPKTIFIDEIQRIPEILNTIQVIIDNNKKDYKFYLTGSSARKLKRGSANLLPGRLFSYRLGTLSCVELDFKLDTMKALELGTLPEPYFSKDRAFAEKLLTTYTATYLQEEILAETLIRDLKGFSQFLKIVCEHSGLLLDFSKLATKSKVSRSACRRYFEILMDSLVCDELQAFAPEDSDEANLFVKHSKYYLFDIGVVNGGVGYFKASKERVGLLFEHLFFNQLRNLAYALDKDFGIYFLRTHSGLEVDFVLRNKQKEYLLIELKTSEPDSDAVSKLKKISDQFPHPHQIFIGCIKCQPKKKGDIKILPWQEIMKFLVDWI